MEILNKFNRFMLKKQKIRYYIFLVIISFSLGFALAFLISMLTMPYNPASVNKTEVLIDSYNNYINFKMPLISNSFLKTFSGNLFSGLFVLLIPGIVFIFMVNLISKLKQYPKFCFELKNQNPLDRVKVGLKYLILIISLVYALKSFSVNNLYVYFTMLPLNIATISSFPHAIFEIPAMLIPSVVSLYIIDEIYEISHENDTVVSKSKIKNLCRQLLEVIIILIILLLIAAYIEDLVMPTMFIHALGNYLFKS